MSANEKHFYRGRSARAQGEPRAIRDGRLSPAARQQWLAGWDEEDRFRQPPPTSAELAEAASVVQRLKQFARNL